MTDASVVTAASRRALARDLQAPTDDDYRSSLDAVIWSTCAPVIASIPRGGERLATDDSDVRSCRERKSEERGNADRALLLLGSPRHAQLVRRRCGTPRHPPRRADSRRWQIGMRVAPGCAGRLAVGRGRWQRTRARELTTLQSRSRGPVRLRSSSQYRASDHAPSPCRRCCSPRRRS